MTNFFGLDNLCSYIIAFIHDVMICIPLESVSDYIYIYLLYNKFTEASHHDTLNIAQGRWM